LFWSERDLNSRDSNGSLQTTHAFFLDLRDGSQQSITFDDPHGVEQAAWNADGMLRVTMRQTHIEHIVDPGTGRILR